MNAGEVVGIEVVLIERALDGVVKLGEVVAANNLVEAL